MSGVDGTGASARLAAVAAVAACAAAACTLVACRWLNCREGPEDKACPRCPQCRPASFLVSAASQKSPPRPGGKQSRLGGLDGASSTPTSSPGKVGVDRALEAPSPLRTVPGQGGQKVDPYSPLKRVGYLEWDDYFMAVAFLSAKRSKDPNRQTFKSSPLAGLRWRVPHCGQVGACIVGVDRIILGIGYNGFPRGCPDDALPWAKLSAGNDPLETKYPYVCHAEMNAILNKNQSSLDGCSIYVTMYPCNECAKLIIQAGLKRVVYFQGKLDGGGKIDPSYLASNRMFKLAKVEVVQHQPNEPITLPFSHN